MKDEAGNETEAYEGKIKKVRNTMFRAGVFNLGSMGGFSGVREDQMKIAIYICYTFYMKKSIFSIYFLI